MSNAKESLKKIEEQKKSLLPTPPVGCSVVWYDRNNDKNPRAAVVTGIEEAGRVKLTIFPPNGMPQHKQGVFHTWHPCHQLKGNAQTMRCGSWDYLPETKIPAWHYNAHKERLEQRAEAIEMDELHHQQAVENKKKREQEMAAV